MDSSTEPLTGAQPDPDEPLTGSAEPAELLDDRGDGEDEER